MKPEERVVAKLCRELKKAAARYGYTCHIDKPPATRFNSNGRPDLFVDFGPFHFRIEVKADAKKKLSPLQADYFEERSGWQPLLCHEVKGLEQVDQFIENLPTLLEQMCTWYASMSPPITGTT
jgi:hypothetical protein